MTTSKTLAALTQWLALTSEERACFDRARGALALAGIGSPQPPASKPTDEPSQLSFHALGISPAAVTAPLPPGSGQRPPRMQVPDIDPAIFGSQAYRRLAPGGQTVTLYVASCLGTAALYRDSRTTIYKAGTTTGCLSARIAGLNTVGYAGWRRAGQTLVEEDGFRSWRAEHLPVTAPRPHGSPVTVTHEGLAVALPAGLAAEAFDVAVTEALAPVSIAHLLELPKFRLGLASTGCSPERLERYTPRSDGRGHKRVAELVRVQPRRDADDLAAVAEGIVAAHVQQAASLAA